MNSDRILDVKNRSSSMVVYKIPEDNIRREFAPGETKKIKYSELEKLSYQGGGRELMANYLQITEEEVTKDLNIKTEPEYYMSEKQVIDLLQTGSLDQFLDALDFAPTGVIDLIKQFSVTLPLENSAKRKALKEKTGFDVDKALVHIEEEKRDVETGEEETPTRRVKTETKTEGRRATSNYKVVSKETTSAEE
jgi:hypothetical protein